MNSDPKLSPEQAEAIRREMLERRAEAAQRTAQDPRTPHDDGEGPTPQRLAMAGDQVETFVPKENENWRAIRLTDRHVLEELLGRGEIKTEWYSAGMRYLSDWYEAGLAHSGVIDPGRVIVDGGKPEFISERRIDAMTRFNRALRRLGREHRHVLRQVVLVETHGLVQYGRDFLHQKNAKLASVRARQRLEDALQVLARHYNPEPPPPRNARHRSSHAPDYRPTIIGGGDVEEEAP